MIPQSRISRRTLLQGVTAAGITAATACTSSEGQHSGLSAAGKPVAGGPKATPDPGVVYPQGYVGPAAAHIGPITSERATLTVVVPQDVQVGDWATNEFSAWYEKRTNVHVRFKEVAASSTNSASDELMTKVNAMISSGDLPDVFMLSPGFTPSQLDLYGSNQNLFVPLGDLIEKYCPQTRRIFADYPEAKKAYTLPDGKIYSMPNINDCFQCRAGNDRAWIYKPWLDKLGLSMPTTLDEFEEVLKAFATRNPNGDRKHDVIPFTTDASTTTFDQFIMGSFLYNPGSPWLLLNDGKVDVVFDKPGWRDGLRYLNKLFVQGLIDKGTFTRSNEQTLRLGNAATPVLGAVRSFYWAGFVDISETGAHPRYRDYVCIPTLKGPTGGRSAAWNYYSPYGIGSFVVTKASKQPAIAAMWADGQYEAEAILRSYIGAEGTGWRWAKRGEVGLNGKQALFKYLTIWPPKPGKAWIQHGVMYRSDDFRLGEAVDPQHPIFEQLLYEETKQACYPYRQPQNQQLPPIAMNTDQAGTIADLQVTINNYVTQTMTKFIQGTNDPNNASAWHSYLDTLNRMGIKKYLSIYQKAYESR